jgi:opacity protein-like surface antigen
MTIAAQAQNREDLKAGTNHLRLLGGYSQNAPSFGLEYERRTGTFGLGAMILHSPKNSDANKPKSTSLGVFATSHLIDRNDLDIYISPGLAVTDMDNIAVSGDDETLFGPTLAIGAQYTLNPHWGIGLQYLSQYNWFSYKVPSEVNYANLVLSYNF